MENNNKSIDELVKKTLSAEEADFYDQLEEQSFLAKIGQVHKGKTGWLVSLMTVVTVLVFIFFVYAVIQFFDTESTKELIKWACAAMLAMMSMSMIKLYIWMQMDKNDLLRELKRLELQIAASTQK